MEPLKKIIFAFPSEEEAALAGAILSEAADEEAASLPFVMREDGRGWAIECYGNGNLVEEDTSRIADLFASANIILRAAPAIEAVPQADWVSLTQKDLAPVRAGRFFVHGSHDRERGASQWAIEIDAGRAFGTAHHVSTKGCLIAIDGLARMRGSKIKQILDLGTGSGILAIAAVKALAYGGRVLATDIDPAAVEVASLNCARNGVRSYVTLKVANGVPPCGNKGQPFDLITANILAKPLIALAKDIRAAVRPGGSVILGGFLEGQAREVIGAYLAKGFAKTRGIALDGWVTAVLRRTH